MASPGEKLRHLRTNRRPRLSQEALAERLNVTRDRLANYESGRSDLPAAVSTRLAAFFHVPESWFFDEEALEPPGPGPGLVLGGGSLSPGYRTEAAAGVGRRLFPVVGSAGAAAFPIESSDEFGDYVEFSDDLFRSNRFAIRVRGDSMEPRLKHGDFVLVHPDSDPPFGLLTIVQNPEHEYVVKVRRMIRGEIVLQPLNPDYPSLHPVQGWQVVGYAVGIREERGKRKYREEGDDDGLRP